MPNECAVSTCSNNSRKTGNSVSYHTFPLRDDIRKLWIIACKRGDSFLNPNTARVCSEHFCSDDYARNLQAELLGFVPARKYLKEDAVPHLNLPKMLTQQSPLSSVSCRETPRQQRKDKREIRKRALSHIEEISPKKMKIDFSTNTESVEISCNDCISLRNKISKDESKMKTMLLRMKCLERENNSLKKKVKKLQKENNELKNNEKKENMYSRRD